MSLAGSQMQTIHNSFIHIPPLAFLSDSPLFPWKWKKKKEKQPYLIFPSEILSVTVNQIVSIKSWETK